MDHANDANGDALRRMEAQGDDLTRPREIEFTIVFPNKESAERFADYFRGLDYKVSVEFSQTVEELPWDVIVKRRMLPLHQAIGDFEDQLQTIADSFGGRNDGWGCFSETSPI